MLTRWSRIALLLIAGLAVPRAGAQAPPVSPGATHTLGLELAARTISQREDLLVPLAFDGPGLDLGLAYRRQREDQAVDLHLSLGLGYLQNRYDHEAATVRLAVRPTWLRRLARTAAKGECWVGLCLPYAMTSDLGLHSWDDSHLYWLTALGLGPAGAWRRAISSRTQVHVQLEAPLVSLVSRPPAYRYAKQDALDHLSFQLGEPHESFRLETVQRYRALRTQATLTRDRQGSLLNLGLEVEYQYYGRPRPFHRVSTALILSYLWRVGR